MKVLNCKFCLKTLSITTALCSLFAIIDNSYAAPRTAIRGTAAARQPAQQATNTTKVEVSSLVVSEPEPVTETITAVNKATQFDNVISSSTSVASSDKNEVAERIKQQRAAIEAQDAKASITTKTAGGRNACDFGLRECMTKTCGKDFTKCATDGDTDLGIKFNACRRNLTCTGEEFKLFTTEIKADRDMNVQLSSYNSVIDCGNEYNGCLLDECGEKLEKCIGKSAADRAVNKCKNIATKCKEQDSGLASRFGTVIGKLREHAEVDVKTKEERMYKLRDLMRGACTKLGATFDERTFDCVYTVNFFAGDNQEIPMASRKRYAGDTFVCNQEWFGIDVTTFKENAYRETRSQKAASAAFLGAGIGTTAGLIASGAMDRALERQKAEKELDEAKSDKDKLECEDKGEDYLWVDGKCRKLHEECKKTYGNGIGKVEKDGDKLVCKLDSCDLSGYEVSKDGTSCTIIGSKSADAAKCEEEGNIWSKGKCNAPGEECSTVLGSGKGQYMLDHETNKLHCVIETCGPTFEPNDDHTGCRSSVGRKKKGNSVAEEEHEDDGSTQNPGKTLATLAVPKADQNAEKRKQQQEKETKQKQEEQTPVAQMRADETELYKTIDHCINYTCSDTEFAKMETLKAKLWDEIDSDHAKKYDTIMQRKHEREAIAAKQAAQKKSKNKPV